MNRLFYITLISTLFLLNSCTKTPQACVNMNSFTYNVGDTIQFKNCTIDASDYLWDFEDGITSTEINPKHSYDSVGDYYVLLTAISKNGKKTHKLTIPIEIN